MKTKLLLIAALSGFGVLTTRAQQTCATAQEITLGVHTVEGINASEAPTPICAPNGNGATGGMWYTFVPEIDMGLIISTDLPQNEGKDTRVHVYSGECGNLVCLAGDDDSGSGYLSYLYLNLTQGTTYYIAFDNKWSSQGFDFNLQEQIYVEDKITFTPANNPSYAANYRICSVDMNGDYLDDLVAISTSNLYISYQQPDGSFNEQVYTLPSYPNMPSWSMAAGDLDNNGYNDLLLGGGQGVSFLFNSDSGDAFSMYTPSNYIFSQRTNMVDINNDGLLDGFVCHDVNKNVYFINNGNHYFDYNQGGLGDHPGGGNYGSIWFDYDNDGDVDLFLSKCRGGSNNGANINELHRNNGDGTFTNVAPDIDMDGAMQTWSSAVGDYNNDGFMDILVGVSSFSTGGYSLKINNGDGTFTDHTVGSGFDTYTGTSYEFIAHDFDNDGLIDIIGPSGSIFFNNGDLTFSKSSYITSEGAIADLNNDGFLDIQGQSNLFYNNGNDNNWIKVTLEGTESNRNGIGARLELHGPWGIQIRDVMSGTGFKYMGTLNQHFGIGEHETIEQLVVKWPSGIIDYVNNPNINEVFHLVEGSILSTQQPQGLLSFSLYPNPATDLLQIKSDTVTFTQATIYDITGKIMQVSAIEASVINVSKLASGTYVVVLKDQTGKYHTDRFIKQ